MKARLLTIAAIVILMLPSSAAAHGYPAAYYKVKPAVCHYFGSYCQQAMLVVKCETGGRYNTTARNGQYLGLFQMGSYARSRYGHSGSAWGQARAAHRYFVASGKDWSPWQCRPWGLGW